MIETGIIVVCLLVNALLAGAEMAFVAVSKPGLRELVRQGHRKAELLLTLREHPERTLSVIQIGITLVAALAGVVSGAGAEEGLSPTIEAWFGVAESTADTIAIGIVVLPLTYFTVVIGELVPKTLALKHAQGFALMAAPWLSFSDKILGPLVSVLEWSTKRLLALLSLWPKRSGQVELGEPAEDTVELGSLSTQHRQYVLNLVDLETKRVQDVYLPWEQVIAVDIEQSAQAVEAVVITSGHTRLPVLRGGAVPGILNTKEFIALRAAGGENWPSLVRPVVELQVKTPLLTGLKLLQDRHIHLGIVYAGQTRVGIITLEDILEEVVGDIYDEDDEETLRRILSSSTKARGHWPQRSLDPSRRPPSS
jgi:putative hemolysin